MSNLIVKHWNSKERRLPGIDCIAYPDGKVIILNCYSLYNPNTEEKKLFCKPLCDTTIDSLEKYDATYWTQVDEWTSIGYQGGKIYGGDGAMKALLPVPMRTITWCGGYFLKIQTLSKV